MRTCSAGGRWGGCCRPRNTIDENDAVRHGRIRRRVGRRSAFRRAILYLTYRDARARFPAAGEGPVCPKCGAGADRCRKLAGKTTRPGLWKCYACMKPFTTKMGTVFESSHVPLHVWLQAVHLMVSSKKGVSSNQIHRTMGVTLKTAWFMTHRIRLAMAEPGWPLAGKSGGEGETLEADETFVGGKAENRAYGPTPPKQSVFALVERGGRVRSFHVPNVTATNLAPIIARHAHPDSQFNSDEANSISGTATGSGRGMTMWPGSTKCWRVSSASG